MHLALADGDSVRKKVFATTALMHNRGKECPEDNNDNNNKQSKAGAGGASFFVFFFHVCCHHLPKEMNNPSVDPVSLDVCKPATKWAALILLSNLLVLAVVQSEMLLPSKMPHIIDPPLDNPDMEGGVW